MTPPKTYEELLAENETLSWQLEEANDTLEAIRTGQIDALVVKGESGHELYSLKTADHTYRLFIEKMNEGALTLNDAGIIIYCNSAFARMVDMPLTRVLGAAFETFVPKNHREEFGQMFVASRAEDVRKEFPLKGSKGIIPCQLSMTILELDEGPALSIILTDLTFQKKIQALLSLNNAQLSSTNQALEKSNHDLLQFASVASHDLQEPLRKILIFTDMLRVKLKGNKGEEVGMFLKKITSSSLRMKGLITDILSYSRLSMDKPQYDATNLNNLIADILDDYEVLIEEKGARVTVDELPVIDAAPGQIRQVFQNLISNALKFTRPGVAPLIEIRRCEATSPGLCGISISDNGIGFDPQYADRIFSLFHRLNTKDQYEGSGIGLAVTKQIIDKHNGSISAESKEGAGSVFRLMLPMKQNTEVSKN